MFLLQITGIEFVKNDHQTVAYQKTVTHWMEQWTVANNFMPIMLPLGNGADVGTTAPGKALAVNKLLDYMEQAIPSVMKGTRDEHAKDFLFSFDMYRIRFGEEATFVGRSTFFGDAPLKVIEAANGD